MELPTYFKSIKSKWIIINVSPFVIYTNKEGTPETYINCHNGMP